MMDNLITALGRIANLRDTLLTIVDAPASFARQMAIDALHDDDIAAEIQAEQSREEEINR